MSQKYTKMIAWLVCITLTVTVFFTGCGDSDSTATDSSASMVDALSITGDGAIAENISSELDQYYVNEKFMLEMLVNDNCIIEENGATLSITTEGQHAAIILSMIPGIQNLGAAAELAKVTVQTAFPNAEIGEVNDVNLFGARAKNCTYSFQDDDGTHWGVEATSIVNQSCYFMKLCRQLP